MKEHQSIYSLKELHDFLENHGDKSKVIVYFDIDLTLIQDNEHDIEELIEPEITKELFNYIIKNNILFSFITARFHDTVCNKKKRDLVSMKKDVDESIFPMLENLGIDLSLHKGKDLEDKCHVIKSNFGRCVGILYRGIFFSPRKGETIKYYQKESGLEKTHPDIIFIDDLDYYLKGVSRHVPSATVLKRKIKNDL
jgi:hypothetical protein